MRKGVKRENTLILYGLYYIAKILNTYIQYNII